MAEVPDWIPPSYGVYPKLIIAPQPIIDKLQPLYPEYDYVCPLTLGDLDDRTAGRQEE